MGLKGVLGSAKGKERAETIDEDGSEAENIRVGQGSDKSSGNTDFSPGKKSRKSVDDPDVPPPIITDESALPQNQPSEPIPVTPSSVRIKRLSSG